MTASRLSDSSLDDEDQAVEHCIEQICARGCKVVCQVIARLRSGPPPAELAQLGAAERDRVLVELESIMAIYAENDSVCLLNER